MQDFSKTFPLSQKQSITGTRHLAREKVLQVVNAFYVSESSLDIIFSHVFFRKFRFDENEEIIEKLLTPDEITEIDADIPINWKDEEITFARKLINTTIDNHIKFDEMISEFADNWDLKRIATVDRILLHLALCELLYFADIPPKVTINEAIEIAKKYSTDKSGIFVNGVLDSLYAKLKQDEKISKSGTGLLES